MGSSAGYQIMHRFVGVGAVRQTRVKTLPIFPRPNARIIMMMSSLFTSDEVPRMLSSALARAGTARGITLGRIAAC